jgi:hypothetical protein
MYNEWAHFSGADLDLIIIIVWSLAGVLLVVIIVSLIWAAVNYYKGVRADLRKLKEDPDNPVINKVSKQEKARIARMEKNAARMAQRQREAEGVSDSESDISSNSDDPHEDGSPRPNKKKVKKPKVSSGADEKVRKGGKPPKRELRVFKDEADGGKLSSLKDPTMAKGEKVPESNEPNSSLDEMDSSEKNIMMSPEMEQINVGKNDRLEQKIIEEAPQKFVYDKAAAKKRKEQLKGSKKNQIVPSVDLNKAASLNISVRPENLSNKGGLGFSNASLNTNLAKSLPPDWDKVLPKPKLTANPNSPPKSAYIPQKYSLGQKKKTGQYNNVQVDIEQEMEREFDAKMSSQRREKEMQRTLTEKLE